MKYANLIGIITAFMLCVSMASAGEPFRVDENLNMLSNDIYNATNINATKLYQNGNQVMDTSGGLNITSLEITNNLSVGDTATILNLKATNLEKNLDGTGFNFTINKIIASFISSFTAVGNILLGNFNITGVDELSATLVDTTNLEADNLESNIDATGYSITASTEIASITGDFDNLEVTNLESNLDGTGYNITANTFIGDYTNGSVLFITNDGRLTEANNFLYFESNGTEGKLGVGSSGTLRNIIQAVKESSETNMSKVKALITVRNSGTTNNNWAGYAMQTVDNESTVVSGTRILTEFQSHAANNVTADAIWDTRHEGTRTEKLRLTSDGNLGIGTTSPSSKLDVNGSITTDTLNTGNGALELYDILGDFSTTSPITGGTNNVLYGTNGNKFTLGITVLKDIVAGTGLSGGGNDVLPGADADVTLAVEKLGDFTVSGTGMSGGGANTLAGDDTFDTTVTLTTAKDIVASGTGMSGGEDNVLPGADADVTITLTTSKDIVASGTGMSGGENDVLPGADADVTITLTTAKDLVAGTSLSGGENDVFPGADADVTLSVTADGITDTQLEYNTGQHLTTTSTVQFDNITGTWILADIESDRVKNPPATCSSFAAIKSFNNNFSSATCQDAWIHRTGGDSGTGDLSWGSFFYVNDTTNRVGIGTATPIAKLDIIGTNALVAKLQNTNADETKLLLSTSATPSAANVGVMIVANRTDIVSNGDTNLEFFVSRGTELIKYMTIEPRAGYVGIGTSTPTSALEVNGDIELQDDDWIGITGAERIYFDSDGDDIELMGADVGIGTQSPSAKLDVVGDVEVNGEVHITDTVTGANAGSDLCIDANGRLCVCGSCA